MRFEAEDADPLRGRVVYDRQDYSFDFLPDSREVVDRVVGSGGSADLTIDTLQIEVGVENGRLLYIWGFCPMSGWRQAHVGAPRVSSHTAIVVRGADLERGVGKALDPQHEWITDWDAASGWVRCHARASASGECVEFAQDSVVEIDRGHLVAVWLRPEFK